MQQKEKVINYYNATHIDYRALWSGDIDRAIHFGFYDDLAKNHRTAGLRLNQVLAEKVHIEDSDIVIDAGCGYGGSAFWLAEKIGCKVFGITLVPFQVVKGQRYLKERKLEDKVEILEMDFSNTTFDNESFSVYWALESLVHAENRADVLKEAYRLLKPGGRIVIAEYTLREKPPLSDNDKMYLHRWLKGWAMPELLGAGEYYKKLQEAGFKQIEIQNVSENVRPSLRRLEILSILNFPIAFFIAPFFFKKERLQNYYASWRQIKALKRGLWEYSIIVAQK